MAAAPAAKVSHHLELWASVATGLEDDALEEIRGVMDPSMAPRKVPGQVLFCVARARDPADVAASMQRLSVCDYVFAKLASCSLTDAPKDVGGDRGLRSVTAAAAGCAPALAAFKPLWRAVDGSRGDAPATFRDRKSVV